MLHGGFIKIPFITVKLFFIFLKISNDKKNYLRLHGGFIKSQFITQKLIFYFFKIRK